MSKFYVALILLSLNSCFKSHEVTPKMGDRVRFKFEGRNSFLSNSCKNEGAILDFIEGIYDIEYAVKVSCVLEKKEETRFIWVEKKDIVEVVNLATIRNKNYESN